MNENTAEPWRICELDFYFDFSVIYFRWKAVSCFLGTLSIERSKHAHTHMKKKRTENWCWMLLTWCVHFFATIHSLCFKETHSAKRLWKREVRNSFSHHIRSYKSTTGHHNTFIIIISNNSEKNKKKTKHQQWIWTTMNRIKKCATVPIAISASLHWS